jgi:hypothetical protein
MCAGQFESGSAMIKRDFRPAIRYVALITGFLWIIFLLQIPFVYIRMAGIAVLPYISKRPLLFFKMTGKTRCGQVRPG